MEQYSQGTQPVPSDMYQTWDFGNDLWLTNEQYDYLMANAQPVNDQPKIIKAGEYKSNYTLTTIPYERYQLCQSAETDRKWLVDNHGITIKPKIMYLQDDISYEIIKMSLASEFGDIYENDVPSSKTPCMATYGNVYVNGEFYYDYAGAFALENFTDQTFEVETDQEVSDDFYEWFNENTTKTKAFIKAGWYRLKDELLNGSIYRFDFTPNGYINYNAEEFRTYKNLTERTWNKFELWNHYYNDPQSEYYNRTGVSCLDDNGNRESLADLSGKW